MTQKEINELFKDIDYEEAAYLEEDLIECYQNHDFHDDEDGDYCIMNDYLAIANLLKYVASWNDMTDDYMKKEFIKIFNTLMLK